MTISDKTDQLFAALVKCQADMEGAIKDAVNPAFKSKYADLAAVLDAAKGPMSKAGLALSIIPGTDPTGAGVHLTALLAHASGQFMQFDPFLVLVSKKDAQGQGSAITYGRRYLTMSILGIPAEDDDGNAASHPQKPSQPPRAANPEPKAPSKLEETKDFLNANKDNFTKEQSATIRTELASAGTTPALLDALRSKAEGFLKANRASTDGAAAAFAGHGFEVVPE